MDDIQVFSQWTPNPNAYKFIVSEFLIDQGKVTFNELGECSDIPLVWALMCMESVTQVHLYENVLTVTQDGSKDWGELSESVEAILQQYLPTHDTHVIKEIQKKRPDLSPELQVIDDIIDRTIRPGLQGDGGDVELVDIENHILSIRYEGACGSCPSAMFGTLQAITGILQDEYDSEIEVVVV